MRFFGEQQFREMLERGIDEARKHDKVARVILREKSGTKVLNIVRIERSPEGVTVVVE